MKLEDFKKDQNLGHVFLALANLCFDLDPNSEAIFASIPDFRKELYEKYSSSRFLEELLTKVNETPVSSSSVSESKEASTETKEKEEKASAPSVDFSAFF